MKRICRRMGRHRFTEVTPANEDQAVGQAREDAGEPEHAMRKHRIRSLLAPAQASERNVKGTDSKSALIKRRIEIAAIGEFFWRSAR